MRLNTSLIFILVALIGLSSCVSKKKFINMEESYKQNLALANEQLGECGVSLHEYMNRLAACDSDLKNARTKLEFRQDESGGVAGICTFPDGSECDEWAYFRKECQPGDSLENLNSDRSRSMISRHNWKM